MKFVKIKDLTLCVGRRNDMGRILFMISTVVLFIYAPYIAWFPLVCLMVSEDTNSKPKIVLPKYSRFKLEG